MKKILSSLLISALSFSAHAKDRVRCAVKSSLGNGDVIIDLDRDYRYMIGYKEFYFGSMRNSIKILVWETKGGLASLNTFEIGGVKLTNANMEAGVSTGSLSYSVDCELLK